MVNVSEIYLKVMYEKCRLRLAFLHFTTESRTSLYQLATPYINRYFPLTPTSVKGVQVIQMALHTLLTVVVKARDTYVYLTQQCPDGFLCRVIHEAITGRGVGIRRVSETMVEQCLVTACWHSVLGGCLQQAAHRSTLAWSACLLRRLAALLAGYRYAGLLMPMQAALGSLQMMSPTLTWDTTNYI